MSRYHLAAAASAAAAAGMALGCADCEAQAVGVRPWIPLTSSTMAEATAKVAPALVNITVTSPGIVITSQVGGATTSNNGSQARVECVFPFCLLS